MMAQTDSLRLIATNAINARCEALEFHLQDIHNHVQEIALHNVHHGTASALAAAQLCSSQDLLAVEPDYPKEEPSARSEGLREAFTEHTEAVASVSKAKDIVNKVFPC